jgi:hypothetical protein
VTKARYLESRTFARDRRMWIATLLLGTLVWLGTTAWLNRRVTLAERVPAPPDADGRFVVLAYDRIAAAPDGKNLDRLRLREQLRALAAAGWQPVTLGELRRAYQGSTRLPAKPILLTFDEGYLGTYEAADPVLRELRWPAVMFLETDRQERRDVSFLFWDRIRRMAGSGLWEIASGDPSSGPRPVAPHALPELPPGASLIAERLQSEAAPAWAPRGAEPLDLLGADGSLAGAAGAVPWLGFIDDPVGANDPASSPFRIARLRVDPRWTTPELLRRSEVAVADIAERREAKQLGADRTVWVAGEGAVDAGNGMIRLDGRPRAAVWIPAARWADDWQLDATVRLSRGEFWVVQPGILREHEWRIGGTAAGFYVEVRSPGRPQEVLARASGFGAAGGTHRLSIVKRGGGVAVRWDDRPLTATPMALSERQRGRIGLIAYASEGEAASVVWGLALRRFAYGVQVVSALPSASEIAKLASSADAIAALSPPWARLEGSSVRESGFDRDLFRMVGRRYAWDLVPTIAIAGNAPPSREASAWLAGVPDRLRRESWAGVRLDFTSTRPSAIGAWDQTVRDLGAGLRHEHLRLIRAAP